MCLTRTLTAILLLTLAGCSNVPERIRTAPPSSPPLQQVRQNPEEFIGASARWGGTIARVQNLQGETRIEIVGRELYRDGEPKQTDRTEGRFIARINGFIDPAIYSSGRSLTVLGTISGAVEHKLGEMNYRYPLLDTEAHYLWPLPLKHSDPYDPWFYDPWYPYPWRRYPY